MEATQDRLGRRIAAVDLLRGLIMIVMALDHTRDFFSNAHLNPMDPVHSWPALYITRWITHLCAPGFVALAGTSVYLQRKRGRAAGEMGRKLVLRGLWLMLIDVTVVSFALYFSPHRHFLQVLYAIGGSMIVLAVLQYLPTRWVAAYGFVVTLLHNLLDKVQPDHLGGGKAAWELIVSTGFFFDHGSLWAFVMYPILPWSGVMALGYAFGAVVLLAPAQRRSRSILFGAAALVLFAALRFPNVYGDPVAFEHLGTATRTAMSFFDVTKYPPSLQYLSATLGVLLLLLALADYALEQRWVPRALGAVEIYGRVPFFYYVIHFYVLHVLAVVVCMMIRHTVHVPIDATALRPVGAGPFGLPAVYAIWIAVVAALYWPCKWFAGVKARRRDWWLSYL